MKFARHLHLRKRYYFITLLLIATIQLLDHVGLFVGVDNFCYDLFFRLRGERSPSSEIVLVVVDDRSHDELGRWPIPRRHYAELLDRLGKARVVGFDLLFTEPSPDDEEYAAALHRYGNPVLATYVLERLSVAGPSFDYLADALGHVHVDPSPDGVVRNVFHTIMVDGRRVSSFASAIYRRLAARQTMNELPRTLEEHDAGFIVQTDRMRINFYGGEGTFPHIPLDEVLDGEVWSVAYFDEKIVLVGTTATGITDLMFTPFSVEGRGLSAVELQANILGNLLDGSAIVTIGEATHYLLVTAFSISLMLLLTSYVSTCPVLFAASSAAALLCASFLLFITWHIWISPTSYVCAAMGVLCCAYIYQLEDLGYSLKQADRDWYDTFNSMQDGLVIQDLTGRTIMLNRAAEQLGKTVSEDILAERCRLLVSGAELPMVQFVIDPETNTHLEIGSFARYDAHGKQSGVVHLVRDVTEKHRMTDQRNALQAQLIHAQKMEAIATLAGGIAHDFNNLLSPIIGYAELVKVRLPEGSEAHSMVCEVHKASLRAKDLVRQILGLSRKEDHGKKQLLPLQPVITEALKLSRSLIPSTIEIRERLDRTCGSVWCIPSQIHQIVMNLCTNAYHAMSQTGGILEVTLDRVAAPPGGSERRQLASVSYVCLRIRDTGHGMDRNTLDRIFDPYFTTKAAGEGTGLGLSVVRSIVEAHDGLLDVTSSLGRGTTFMIYFPTEQEAEAEQDHGAPDQPARGSAHILVVDDDPAVAATQARLLESLGYRVTTHTSSIRGLIDFEERPDRYDLVITDQTMPRMNGIELSRKLRDTNPSLKIILCTGYQSTELTEKSRKMGIDHILLKPVGAAELADGVHKVLNGR